MSTSPDEISLTPGQRAFLARIADDRGLPWPAVLAEALASLHEPTPEPNNGETVYEAMVRHGLLGCVNGPPDLSTNPKYMEGFGEHGR